MNRRRAEDQFAELARELTRVNRSNPVLALYRWRYEIVVVALIPLALTALFRTTGPIWSLVVLACAGNAVFHWPAARRFVRGRVRAVVAQHRLRTAFAKARVCTPGGRRPAILWTKPRDEEIRILLFCPAGIGVDRIHDRRRLLAAACFATDVIVKRHPRYAHLVFVSIRTAKPRRDGDY